MRVYRSASKDFATNSLFPVYQENDIWYDSDGQNKQKCIVQPIVGEVIHTGADFESLTTPLSTVIVANKYYQLQSVDSNGYAVWIEIATNTTTVVDIMEVTYHGEDMGKRSVTATIKWPTPIDFHIGDFVEIPMQSLLRGDEKRGSIITERFYIYHEPQCKKTARPMSTGDAFEINVTFYPRQYELSRVQMRDFLQQSGDGTPIIYTGFDEVTFYGGAHELLERCMACLNQQFIGNDGKPLWKYVLADSANEDINNALERYALTFSGQSVMDAIMKLNDKDGINTSFFINDRTIYVGYERPYLCKVNAQGAIEDTPLKLMYGKTSHQNIDLDHGGLYDITKAVSEEQPITKLYAYGASRNLNRYYCSDRIQSGRFVNKLMLPSFSDDGKTDFIISEDGVKKYGIVERSQNFEQIYPSLRYMTYADIRGIKYCIKIRYSGLATDIFDNGTTMTHHNSNSTYPVARVQCYKVIPSATTGVNTLIEAAPPTDLAVYIHATGKTVKVVLFGGANDAEAIGKQIQHDGKIPTTDGVTPSVGGDYSNVHPGSCFCVHDIGWPDMDGTTHTAQEREDWFNAAFRRIGETDPLYAETTEQQQAELHRIEYVDTFWLTDLYEFTSYDQTFFQRDGYSAWAWPRLNGESNYPDSLLVNEVVAVEPISIADTSDNINSGRQQHWDIYLRDLGFAIDEQNDFGEMVFVFSTPVVSVLDGTLAGREFTIDGGENLNNFQNRVVCAYNEDGSFNQDFLEIGDSKNDSIAPKAFAEGAIWRIRLNRNDSDDFLKSVGIVIPNTDIQMSSGDHIVLLDIYMPDIYVRAAEKRLLNEAQKFLEKNDKGNINYSISFDKVRIQQIPNYALQMREGVQLRVLDEDLKMASDNAIRQLVKYNVPAQYNVPLFESKYETETVNSSSEYTYHWGGSFGKPRFDEILMYYDETDNEMRISIPMIDPTATFTRIRIRYTGASYAVTPSNQVASTVDGTRWLVTFDCDSSLYLGLYRANDIKITVEESYIKTNYTKTIKTSNDYVPAICQDFINFKANKHYEVVVLVDANKWSNSALNWKPGLGRKDIYLTTLRGDAVSYYKPNYILDIETNDGISKLTYIFHLPNNFNDANGYYVGLAYHGNGQDEYGIVQMVSVTERDLDEHNRKVNYVDFIASSVNVKITDNTRDADSRILGVYPEPIREIDAQITEQTRTSAWGQLMKDTQQNTIELESLQKTYDSFVQTARINYQQLLNVRNAIFDPDGTCTDLFVQTMMLQVGADSMNYQLEKTLTTPTGVMSNFTVTQKTASANCRFQVNEDDVLHHFVYTQGAENAGNWVIPGHFDAELAPVDGVYPTYYVCIRCKKNNANDISEPAWICSTRQYAVNEDTPGTSEGDYWYFNWGILIADSNGNYTLTETRGNAYMYGDNIICGKISTLAGNSYFDLTHGNFVLSSGDTPSLSYINGVLTISGINDNTANSVLARLGILEDPHTNLWPVDEELNIGLNDRETLFLGYIMANRFSANDSFRLTCEVTEYTPSEEYGTEIGYTYLGLKVTYIDENNDEQTFWTDYGDSGTYSFTEDKKISWLIDVGELIELIDNGDITIKEIMVYVEPHLSFSEKVSFTLHKCMVVNGDYTGTYSLAYKHLTDALQGSTQIAGGIMMTNLLMLKNESGAVSAGMSGLSDDSTIPGKESAGVTLWGGGSYEQALAQAQAFAQGTIAQLQTLLPVLITKNGIGSKIGSLEIISNDTISVRTDDGRIEISVSRGITVYNKKGFECVNISSEELSDSSYDFGRLFLYLYEYGPEQLSDASSVLRYGATEFGSVALGTVPAGSYDVYDGSNGASGKFLLRIALSYWDRVYRGRSIGWVEGYKGYDSNYNISAEYNIYLKNISDNSIYYLNKGEGTSTHGLSHIDIVSLSSGAAVLEIDDEIRNISLSSGTYYLMCDVCFYGDVIASKKHQMMLTPYNQPVIMSQSDETPKVLIGSNGLIASQGNGKALIALTDSGSSYLKLKFLGIPPQSSAFVENGAIYKTSDGTIKVV